MISMGQFLIEDKVIVPEGDFSDYLWQDDNKAFGVGKRKTSKTAEAEDETQISHISDSSKESKRKAPVALPASATRRSKRRKEGPKIQVLVTGISALTKTEENVSTFLPCFVDSNFRIKSSHFEMIMTIPLFLALDAFQIWRSPC
jgi:hypothetical protein